MPSVKIQRLHLSWHKSLREHCCCSPGTSDSSWTQGCSSLEEGCCKESKERLIGTRGFSTPCIKLLKMVKVRSQSIGLVQQKEAFPWEAASAMNPLLPSRPKHEQELKEDQKVVGGAGRTPHSEFTAVHTSLITGAIPNPCYNRTQSKGCCCCCRSSYQKAGGRICSQWKELQKATLLKIQITPRKCPWPSDDFRGWAFQLNISAKLLLVCRTEILAWTMSTWITKAATDFGIEPHRQQHLFTKVRIYHLFLQYQQFIQAGFIRGRAASRRSCISPPLCQLSNHLQHW